MVPSNPGGRADAARSRAASARCPVAVPDGDHLFWITDTSATQTRTTRLVEVSVRVVVWLLRLANLPFTRPLRKPLLELIQIVKGDA